MNQREEINCRGERTKEAGRKLRIQFNFLQIAKPKRTFLLGGYPTLNAADGVQMGTSGVDFDFVIKNIPCHLLDSRKIKQGKIKV